MFVPLSPLEFKRRAVRLYGSKLGVIDGDRRFTYREFGERTDRLANALLDLGLAPRDRVACLAYNSYPLLEAYYGVLEAGGILLPINIRLSPDEIAYILGDSAATFLLADGDFAPLLARIWPELERKPVVIWLTEKPAEMKGSLYDDVLDQSSSAPPPALEVDENSVAELFYTSGTTGMPKGVMLTHRALYLHALSSLISMGGADSDVQLHTIPLFHVNGWGTPQAMTAAGGTHVMMRKFDPTDALRLIEQERVTRFYAVPTMVNAILNHPDLERYDVRSLRLVMVGGAPMPPEMVRRGEAAFHCEVKAGYGLSETSPVLAIAADKAFPPSDEDERVRRLASTGLPVIGADVRIVDTEGNDVEWNGADSGEIVVRSNAVMDGYWNSPESTAAAIQDGWFHTGDMAVIDPEGYVLIVDRLKDIVVSGGENISTVEIENVLYEHPAVLECAVIGVPDDRWGEVPAAIVALKPGRTAEAEELIAFCRDHLASFKLPKRIDFAESLPKGGTGKILKRELREPYWQGHEKRVH